MIQNNAKNGVIVQQYDLALREVNRSQAGNYTCVASNVEGDGYSNIVELKIMCEYSAPSLILHIAYRTYPSRVAKVQIKMHADAKRRLLRCLYGKRNFVSNNFKSSLRHGSRPPLSKITFLPLRSLFTKPALITPFSAQNPCNYFTRQSGAQRRKYFNVIRCKRHGDVTDD